MMPKGEDGGTSLSAANIDTSDRNGGGGDAEAFAATEDADELGDVSVPWSNGEKGSDPLQYHDDLTALEGDRLEQEGKGRVDRFEAENATAAGATQQEQQVRITILSVWNSIGVGLGPHAMVSCCYSWHNCQ